MKRWLEKSRASYVIGLPFMVEVDFLKFRTATLWDNEECVDTHIMGIEAENSQWIFRFKNNKIRWMLAVFEKLDENITPNMFVFSNMLKPLEKRSGASLRAELSEHLEQNYLQILA